MTGSRSRRRAGRRRPLSRSRRRRGHMSHLPHGAESVSRRGEHVEDRTVGEQTVLAHPVRGCRGRRVVRVVLDGHLASTNPGIRLLSMAAGGGAVNRHRPAVPRGQVDRPRLSAAVRTATSGSGVSHRESIGAGRVRHSHVEADGQARNRCGVDRAQVDRPQRGDVADETRVCLPGLGPAGLLPAEQPFDETHGTPFGTPEFGRPTLGRERVRPMGRGSESSAAQGRRIPSSAPSRVGGIRTRGCRPVCNRASPR